MNERLGVIGYGDAARAAVNLALAEGFEVWLTDDAGRPADLPDAVTWVAPGEPLPVTVVVPSPGVPPRHPAVAGAAEVWSDIEFAFRCGLRPAAAITGTNGKSTVTALAVHLLVQAGVPAVAAGNFGPPASAQVRAGSARVVLECSSYQLQFTDRFAATVGVLLNLAPDHLDWHGTFAHYAAAKARVFRGADVCVPSREDVIAWAAAHAAAGEVAGFGLGSPDPQDRRTVWHLAGHDLCDPEGTPFARDDGLWQPGEVATRNALAGSAVAVRLGASPEALRAGLASFPGLPHRMAVVASRDGVTWIDDSKATNPHAVLADLAGRDRIVLIAGGRNKDLDLSGLAALAPRLVAVVAIGETAAEIRAALVGVPGVEAFDMHDAVAAAAAYASPGDTVILAPACASFDWYTDYRARGDAFAAAVHAQVAK